MQIMTMFNCLSHAVCALLSLKGSGPDETGGGVNVEYLIPGYSYLTVSQ